MSDGHVNKCKDCNKKDVSENYERNVTETPGFIDKERKRGRDKFHRLYTGMGKSNPTSTNNHKEKYPEKRKAISMSTSLPKPFDNAERHHWSYNESHYKDVIWLTKKEHMKAHRFIIYDQLFFKYRRIDTGHLLLTKEEHEKYIKHCIINNED